MPPSESTGVGRQLRAPCAAFAVLPRLPNGSAEPPASAVQLGQETASAASAEALGAERHQSCPDEQGDQPERQAHLRGSPQHGPPAICGPAIQAEQARLSSSDEVTSGHQAVGDHHQASHDERHNCRLNDDVGYVSAEPQFGASPRTCERFS